MMFDTTYRIGEPVVQLMPDENGDVYELQVIAPVLMMIPVAPQQAMLVQAGILRLPMDKNVVDNLSSAFAEAQESMKARSQIQTASSMSEAEVLAQMKQQAEALRNG
jgi:hypothetical protein